MGFSKNNGRLGDGPEKPTRTAPPRICMPTWRNFTKKTCRCSRYEEGNFSVWLPLCPRREWRLVSGV
jgi:hypothetical protein